MHKFLKAHINGGRGFLWLLAIFFKDEQRHRIEPLLMFYSVSFVSAAIVLAIKLL